MLITKNVIVKWNGNNKEWYESKGYIFTKFKNEFEVRVEDLTHGSHAPVKVKCDCEFCEKPYLKPMQWRNYTQCVHNDGKYYCLRCTRSMYTGEINRKTALKKSGSISETNPHLIKYFVNIEDTKKYTAHSHNKVPLKCPDCGFIKTNTTIHYLTSHGIACPKCGDGVSYPEKIMFNVLEQLGLEIIPQLSKITFKWCNDYRYDFYIPSINSIVETHGKQHYEENKNWCMSLNETQENDRLKKELALNNSIKEDNYIIINCKRSELECIKNNILNSNLAKLFDLTKIDWLKCDEIACEGLIKKACDIFNSGVRSPRGIAEILKLHSSTIINYLKRGNNLNWCDYDVKEENRKQCIILGKDTGKKVEIFKEEISLGIFESCAELERQSQNIFNTKLLGCAMSMVCSGKRKHHKGYTFKYIK